MLDSLAPLPDHLVGKYDVVHIGLLVMIIKNENPGPLMQNVIKMLSESPMGHNNRSSASFSWEFAFNLSFILRMLIKASIGRHRAEPGGYLQWDEVDVGSLNASFPDKNRPCPAYDELHNASQEWFTNHGVTYK